MSWEQEIAEELQEASDSVVRFDIAQNISAANKATAISNVGIGATATNISGDDYTIVLNY